MELDKLNKGVLSVETSPENAPDKLEYSEEEKAYKDFLLKRLKSADNQRNEKHAELDEMDYFTYYDTNKRAANAYIPPKKNKQDTRVVSGTTKEKETTILAALLNYNLEPQIRAFNSENVEISGLGTDMSHLIKRTREMENDEDKQVLRYKELLDQGTIFVEEVWTEKFFIEKNFRFKDFSTLDPNKIDWEAKLKKLYSRAESRIIEGLKVYLGNIREFFIWNQPFIFTAEYMPYDEARQYFGNWERWKYVPRKVQTTKEDRLAGEGTYRYDWAIDKPDEDWVEIIKYQDKPRNEYMLMINGVMMVPIGLPLTSISPSGEYTIAKGDVDPISFNFAYSKSIPANTKVDQEVLDEFLRLMILKTQQSFAPPIANRSKKLLSRNIFQPAAILNDVDPNQVQPLLQNQTQGVTPSEFNAYQFVKGIIDQKTVSPVFSGQSPEGSQTATEITELKKQQMMKLGLTMVGVMSLERQLSWLRTYNLKENLPTSTREESGKLSFPSLTIDNVPLLSGKQGRKIIEFSERANDLTQEQLRREEEYLSEPGRPVEKVVYHPKEFRELRAYFYITITPTEKESDELNRAMFVQNVQDAANLFGIEALNLEYIKQRFAKHAKEDETLFFRQERETRPEQTPIGQQQMEGRSQEQSLENLQRQQGVGGELNKQLTEGARAAGSASRRPQ